jgi:hypothetical protein
MKFLLSALIAAALAQQMPLPPVPGADQLGVGIDVISGDFKVCSRN